MKTEFYHHKGDIYHVTGLDVYNRRFSLSTNNPIHAMMINLCNGSVWQIKANAKLTKTGRKQRTLIKRVI